MVVPVTPPGGARDTDAPSKAILCALAGGALLTLQDGFMKTLTADYPIGQLLSVRGAFIYIPIFIIAMRMGGVHMAWQINSWKGQGLRGLCVVCSSFAFITGLYYLPLADAVAIAFAGPLFVTAMAPIFLKEIVGWRRWTAVLVGFFGVLIIVQPGSTAFQWFAIFPLIASMLAGVRDMITRKMAPNETSIAVLFVTTTFVFVAGSLSYFVVDWQPINLDHLPYFAASGLFIGCAHYLLIEAFRWGEAALVSPFKYANVLWATMFGFLLFGDIPGTATIIGAVIVSASGIYILHRERVRVREERENAG